MLVAIGVLPVLWRLPETARLPLSGSVSQLTVPAQRGESAIPISERPSGSR
jgi:hypothetical protein